MKRRRIEKVREVLRDLSYLQTEEWNEELASETAGLIEGMRDAFEMTDCFLELPANSGGADDESLNAAIEGIGIMTNGEQAKPYAKGFRTGRSIGANVALALIRVAEER